MPGQAQPLLSGVPVASIVQPARPVPPMAMPLGNLNIYLFVKYTLLDLKIIF